MTAAPTAAQLAWQRLGAGVFLHVGTNTMTDREWGDGTADPAVWDPVDLDADEWVAAAVAIGARYVVLTAKHHDGFCLWQTATTDYSVAASPWRDGRGDVLRELSDAAARAGIGLGVYVSPWDRHEPTWEQDPAAYSRIFAEQVREVCTGYGPLVEVWFDGAGSEGHRYDWDAVVAVVREHQPDAMVFNMGEPTIRWVGNEDGVAHDPVRYVVETTADSNYTTTSTGLATARYLPPECDVSIRPGWFWHEDESPKSTDHLLGIWYRSIGLGAGLLLNVPPDRRGRIDPADLERLREFRAALDERFARPVPGVAATEPFPGTDAVVDHLLIEEDLADGQRITAVTVHDAAGALLASGGSVGVQRVLVFAPTPASALRLTTDGGGNLSTVTGFDTGGASVPGIAYVASTDRPED